MSIIDDAIARIQDIALSCTDVVIKSAPDYPIENADPCPFVITHLSDGGGVAVNASTLKFMPIVNSDFYFNRTSVKQAYQQSDAVALEFMQRLAGDPTLNSTVDTVIFSEDNHPTFTVESADYGGVVLHLLKFIVPLKTLETPITT